MQQLSEIVQLRRLGRTSLPATGICSAMHTPTVRAARVVLVVIRSLGRSPAAQDLRRPIQSRRHTGLE